MIHYIKHYQISLPAGKEVSKSRAVGYIHGWDKEKIHRLTCHFHAQGCNIPENDIRDKTVQLHYPMRNFSIIRDIFRNESPLTVVYDERTNEGQIMTHHERVGKGDIEDEEFDMENIVVRRYRSEY